MDIETHTKKVMDNVKTLVETGGGTMDSILQNLFPEWRPRANHGSRCRTSREFAGGNQLYCRSHAEGMRGAPMTIRNFWNRRNFLGSAGVLTGTMLGARRVFGMPAVLAAPVEEKLTGFGATGNVYEELGVTTVINGQGTMTYLGGSLPRPEVEAVM